MSRKKQAGTAQVSRRNMLFVGGGALAATVAMAAEPVRNLVIGPVERVGPGGLRPASGGSATLATAGYDAWLAKVGSSFSIGGGQSMTLSGVRALASGGERPANLGRASAFVAVFDPVGATQLAGDLIYTATTSGSGPLSIFLSSSSDPRTPARMLAVFN